MPTRSPGSISPRSPRSPTFPPAPLQWQAERESGRDDRYRAVWVANHPPLHYVATAPLIWLSNALDRPDGGLLLMRLANIAFAAVGVGAHLSPRPRSQRRSPTDRRRRGGDRRSRSAGAHAVLPGDERRARLRRGDGDGVGRRALHRNESRTLRASGPRAPRGGGRGVRRGARARPLLVAVVVVVWVAVARLRTVDGSVGTAPGRGGAGRGVRARSHRSCCSAGTTCATIGCTATSPDQSSSSIASADVPVGPLLEILTWGHLWIDLYHMLMSPSPLLPIRAPLAQPRLAARRHRSRRRGDHRARRRRRATRRPWHRHPPGARRCASPSSSSSSSPSPNMCPGEAAATPATCCRRSESPRPCWPSDSIGCGRGCLPAITVVLMGWWALRNVPSGVDPAAVRRPRDRGQPMPETAPGAPGEPVAAHRRGRGHRPRLRSP